MPLSPAMRSRYPPDWSTAIVPRIRQRAKNRCERCGVPDGVYVVREVVMGTVLAENWRAADTHKAAMTLKRHWEYSLLMMTREMPSITDPVEIRLSVAHGDDPSPENCDDGNLWLACQRCHRAHDAPQQARIRRQRQRARLFDPKLFEGIEPVTVNDHERTNECQR